MKVLILADLHMNGRHDIAIARRHIHSAMADGVEVAVICGDIFESNYQCNPYKQITKIFDNDIPVICTLGNHEFFDRTIDETLVEYADYYNPDKYDVHYLDIVGHYDIGEYRFLGNVLWYDGSMATIPGQDPNVFVGYESDSDSNVNRKYPTFYPKKSETWAWADRYIKNFDCIQANKDCVQSIRANMGDSTRVHVLCTHCCPHKDLNLHLDDITSPFNAFSGMATFLEEIHPDYAFCGHTHRRTVGKRIGNCYCVNVGNDLHGFQYYIADI